MIGIDTYSWYKLITLYESDWKDLVTKFLITYKVFITHEVKVEFMYRFPMYENLIKLITIGAMKFEEGCK